MFFIFLYQRYIYRVDPKRVNEFGTSGEMFDQNGDVLPVPEGDTDGKGEEPAEPKSIKEKKED